jgi:two-component system, NarL family, sensor histidine kinase DevS
MNSDENPQKNNTNAILAQLNSIASSVMYAAEAPKVEEVLERIAQISKDLVNAKYAALGVPDHSGGLTHFKVAGMTPEQIARMDHLPYGYGLLGAIARERRIIRLERMQDDSRSAGFCQAHPQMTSLLGVPILVGQQLFGILYLCDRIDGQPFSQQDEWLIETVAGYAALAIAGSELTQQHHRLTLLEERERIGMELHDGVIQSLYALGMQLDLLRMNGKASVDDLTDSINMVNLAIDDIRRYIMDLHRTSQQQNTIYEYLDDILKHLHSPETTVIHLDAPHEKPTVAPATFEAICQMANEAISNALRHSQASTINILAIQNTNVFQITIADNGKGFDVNDLASQDGLGLRNIRKRAALYGGQVHIEALPGKGTRLTISIPNRSY